MLDTNIVSNAVHRRSATLAERLLTVPTNQLCVSSISYGETRFGQAQRPTATRLTEAIADFFTEVAVLPWTRETALAYGDLRVAMKRLGKALQPLDMLIAAHALEAGATLVTNDHAFRHVPVLETADWTTE
ncbi:MAG: type II toxin-antitoxin system VapC family toxin [Hyphomicrobiales bacterium]|nr:type II toxin-antitoxin system VapC family toxin [Hyphomicrobiales bacterium]